MTRENFPDCKREPIAICLEYHHNFCEDPSGCKYATQFEQLRETGMPFEQINTEMLLSRMEYLHLLPLSKT